MSIAISRALRRTFFVIERISVDSSTAIVLCAQFVAMNWFAAIRNYAGSHLSLNNGDVVAVIFEK